MTTTKRYINTLRRITRNKLLLTPDVTNEIVSHLERQEKIITNFRKHLSRDEIY